jgi:hypothetical protein
VEVEVDQILLEEMEQLLQQVMEEQDQTYHHYSQHQFLIQESMQVEEEVEQIMVEQQEQVELEVEEQEE